MRIYIRILALAAVFAAAPLFAVFPDDTINQAMELYAKDKPAALAMMTNLYQAAAGQMLKIRAMLAARGFYAFYMEFLRLLPKEKQSVGEIIYEDFATAYYEYLADDIRAYLKFYDKDILINYYYRGIAEEKAVAVLKNEIGDPVFFDILKRSLILANSPDKFDAVLTGHKGTKIPPETVKNFILESWKFKPRDLGGLLAAYDLENDKALRPFYMYSLFVNSRFPEIIALYLLDPSAFPKDLMTSYQIDVPYYAAYSWFRAGDYTKALDMIGKIYMPWNIDQSRFVTLCYMGLGEYKQVKMWMPKIKSGDTFQFIKGFVAILEGKTDDGMKALELYLADTSAAHSHTIEALLLAFTYYNNPAEMADVANIVKLWLLEQPLPGPADISLSQAYVAGQKIADQPSQSKIVDDFVQYKNSVLLMKKGKYDEASLILTKLIKSPETSKLVRALAVFQLRKIPQG